MDDAFARTQALWEAHGDATAWNFLIDDLHNGDLYRFLSLLRPFRRFVARGLPVRLLTSRPAHARLASLFPGQIDEMVVVPAARISGREVREWRRASGRDALAPGGLINLYPIDYFQSPLDWGRLWYLFNDRGIFFIHLFKFLLNLQLDIAPDVSVISDGAREAARSLFEQQALVQGNTLILFPYALSQPFAQDLPRVREHFAALAAHAAANGLQVCTSVVPPEEPIVGTQGVFIPFDVLLPFCELAGYVVTQRSGVSDILAGALCRKLHVYPSQWMADETSPTADGVGGAEINLGFDMVGDPDPARFANVVLSSLRDPYPGDGSAWVPRRIRTLLTLPLATAEPNGRFRIGEFVIRQDYCRLFASGALADGWSGVEDWGTWTLGYRSVLYLKPPTVSLPALAETTDPRVLLLLDLTFAIAPETHEVLEYAIEVNGAVPVWHEARWPDRWRILRIPLHQHELTAPARVTFIMRNPVSSRELSGGAVNDGRVIGIGLLRAGYELDAG